MKNLLSKIKTEFEDNPIRFVSPIAVIILSLLLIFSTAFSTSAADEPIVVAQSDAPTDLTGTSWYVPSGWSAKSRYGQFSINGTYRAEWDGGSAEDGFSKINLGYTTSGPMADRLIFTRTSDGQQIFFGSVTSFLFTFSGGTDVTNSSLISWLMANGTLTNPPEAEPTPTYTIQPNYYQIKLQPDMIPDDVGFYEYGGQFIYEGETYRSLRFARVSSLLTNVSLYDDDGNQVVIKGQTASNDGWFYGRNITLVSPITTENEEAYTYFTENLSATEQSPFDLVTYMISGFFKALDNFYLFFDFTLLDFIFVMCGLFGAIWFLKLLAGG